MPETINIAAGGTASANIHLHRSSIAVLYSSDREGGPGITVDAEGRASANIHLHRSVVTVLYDPSQHFADTFITGEGTPIANVHLHRWVTTILVPTLYGRVRWWDGNEWVSTVTVWAWDGTQWVQSELT